jgi:hypothetical protein
MHLFLNRRGFVCYYPQNITDLLVRDPAQAWCNVFVLAKVERHDGSFYPVF